MQRAIDAAIVPDCSFDDCSHCGVCGVDFGHNVVIEPIPIPQFAGHFVANNTKAQRLRVWFGKLLDMALISHLDLIRLFDRAVRRAALPVSFTGGFHPSPRISIAQALPLGVTSSGEIMDFELTRPVDVETFRQQLSSQLPINIPIYNVAVVDLKAPAATQLLASAEYLITVAVVGCAIAQWQKWVDVILGLDAIWWEQTTKSGSSRLVNLRDRLFELEILESEEDIEPQRASFRCGSASRKTRGGRREHRDGGGEEDCFVLRYVGSCRNDGTQLRPEQVVFMLEQVAQYDMGDSLPWEFQLLHIHRKRLLLH